MYNVLLTMGMKEETKSLFDHTMLDQRLEIDPDSITKVTIIQALNNMLFRSYDSSVENSVLSERKLKEAEDYFVRNFDDFKLKITDLVM